MTEAQRTQICVVFFAIFIPVWLCGVINGILLRRFFTQNYPAIAEAVFEPVSGSHFHHIRYLFRREYTSIEDARFTKRMDFHRRIAIFSFWGILLGMAAAAILIQYTKIK